MRHVERTIAAVVAFLAAVVVVSTIGYTFSRENAPYPGEVLDTQNDATTPVLMKGVFAVEVTSTGVGTITIKRSEDGTNYITVKTLTNTAATEQRKYLYESFGDVDKGNGAYYKAVVTTLTSGSYRVRFVR